MSLLLRRHKRNEVKKPVREEPVSVDEEDKQDFPKHVGGGWYELSNGERVQGKDEAIEAEKGD